MSSTVINAGPACRDGDLFFLIQLSLLLGIFAFANNLVLDNGGFSFLVIAIESLILFTLIGWKTVSLISIYYLFSLMFFSIIPWLHYSEGLIIWGNNGFHETDYLQTNTLIFISNIVVFSVYRFFIRKKAFVVNTWQRKFRQKSSVYISLVIFSSVSFLVLFFLNGFSFQQLFLRGVYGQVSDIAAVENSSLLLFLTLTTRLLPFFCFLFAVTQIKGNLVLKIILFLLLLVSAFPTGVARYMVGFVYIPVLLVFFKTFRNSKIFASSLIISIFFIFPFLNQFRSFSGIGNITFIPGKEFFYAAHFDAYENFARAVQVDFVTYGYQLLGVLFFYFPRALWAEKPVGSGYEMAERLGYQFNNISMPFLGEGYVNFGVLGVFVFRGVLAYIMAKLDKRYLPSLINGRSIDFSTAVYFYICGAFMFVLRGDLLSSTAYLMAGLSVAFFVKAAFSFLGKPSGR